MYQGLGGLDRTCAMSTQKGGVILERSDVVTMNPSEGGAVSKDHNPDQSCVSRGCAIWPDNRAFLWTTRVRISLTPYVPRVICPSDPILPYRSTSFLRGLIPTRICSPLSYKVSDPRKITSPIILTQYNDHNPDRPTLTRLLSIFATLL